MGCRVPSRKCSSTAGKVFVNSTTRWRQCHKWCWVTLVFLLISLSAVAFTWMRQDLFIAGFPVQALGPVVPLQSLHILAHEAIRTKYPKNLHGHHIRTSNRVARRVIVRENPILQRKDNHYVRMDVIAEDGFIIKLVKSRNNAPAALCSPAMDARCRLEMFKVIILLIHFFGVKRNLLVILSLARLKPWPEHPRPCEAWTLEIEAYCLKGDCVMEKWDQLVWRGRASQKFLRLASLSLETALSTGNTARNRLKIPLNRVHAKEWWKLGDRTRSLHICIVLVLRRFSPDTLASIRSTQLETPPSSTPEPHSQKCSLNCCSRHVSGCPLVLSTVSSSTVAYRLAFTHRRIRRSSWTSMVRGAPQFPRRLFPMVLFVHTRYTFARGALTHVRFPLRVSFVVDGYRVAPISLFIIRRRAFPLVLICSVASEAAEGKYRTGGANYTFSQTLARYNINMAVDDEAAVQGELRCRSRCRYMETVCVLLERLLALLAEMSAPFHSEAAYTSVTPGRACVTYSVGEIRMYSENCNGSEHWNLAHKPQIFERSQLLGKCTVPGRCTVYNMGEDTPMPCSSDEVKTRALLKDAINYHLTNLPDSLPNISINEHDFTTEDITRPPTSPAAQLPDAPMSPIAPQLADALATAAVQLAVSTTVTPSRKRTVKARTSPGVSEKAETSGRRPRVARRWLMNVKSASAEPTICPACGLIPSRHLQLPDIGSIPGNEVKDYLIRMLFVFVCARERERREREREREKREREREYTAFACTNAGGHDSRSAVP
ncbi:hypothetical protein PR048_000833 [Dryococelus australis]|uniref:Uncharacterized protein n=1 Tax=Dryococelus australis TaxID=614101 RepID=A0ABQ9IFQ1_9NEOP|nr:hypothetical protein PR048_000833 [Dryococelus australis]